MQDRMYQWYRGQGAVVLPADLTQPDDRDEVDPFQQELGLSFPVLPDEKSLAANCMYHISGFPTIVCVDREGVIPSIYVGVVPAKQVESQTRSHLGVCNNESPIEGHMTGA